MNQPNLIASGSVYLLAEHRLLRETLLRLLAKRGDIAVVGSGRSSESDAEQILTSRCQMVLLDSLGPDGPANLVEELVTRSPETKIILFGMDESPATFLQAIGMGVSGYLLKDASAAEIVGAVRTVAQGHAVCPPQLCATLFQFVFREFRLKPLLTYQEARARFGLTTRQSQLVALVARGLTNKEIAASLNLSEFTVKNHLRRIMRQVDAQSRTEAVEVIRAEGLLPTA